MKDMQKQEVLRKIWNVVDGLKESVDAWEFKNYIFGFLFYRYISEDFLNYVNNHPKVPKDFEYECADDEHEWITKMRETLIKEKGFFIYPNDLFQNIKKKSDNGLQGIGDLNEDVEYAFSRIEKSVQDSKYKKNFEGLFKLMDLANNRLGREIIQKNRRIKKIIDGIHELKFEFENESILGDVYEYLMEEYVAGAGKTGGEFYSPKELSLLLSKLVQVNKSENEIKSIYDPACGTGSMLLKIKNPKDISFFGQEINPTTHSLCKINMFLRGISGDKFNIELGNTLSDNKFTDQRFDVIVSSLPRSGKWRESSSDVFFNDPRFKGPGKLAPKDKTNYAFIMHSLYHLKDDGVAAMVCSPGILFRKSDELTIRKYLIEKNYIDAVIQLADNLFFGKSQCNCLLVFKKNKSDENIFFINAKEWFTKYHGKNKLTEQNINRIHKAYLDRAEEEGFSRIVTREEIEKEGHSLSVGAYVIPKYEEEEIDIEVLNRNSKELSEKIYEINRAIDKIIKDI